MTKYAVHIYRNQFHTADIEVEADNPDAAWDQVWERCKADDPEIKWNDLGIEFEADVKCGNHRTITFRGEFKCSCTG